jgi:hypothetical protein
MNDRFTILVNDNHVEVIRGAKVKHALIALDYSLYKSCVEGRTIVKDEYGFIVGLDGALKEGGRLYTEAVSS